MIVTVKPKAPLIFNAFWLYPGVTVEVNERELLLFLHGEFPGGHIHVEWLSNEYPQGGFKIVMDDTVSYLYEDWVAYRNKNLNTLETIPAQQFIRAHSFE